MRKWGSVITVFYVLVVLGLLTPGAVFLATGHLTSGNLLDTYKAWAPWIPIGIILASQALLLFLSVDTSWKRLKPRAHILVSCLVTAMLLSILTGAVVLCTGFSVFGDKFVNGFLDSAVNVFGCWGTVWAAWTILFYMYCRNSTALITRAAAWLLKGSVLELLVAVPAHVIVRRRHDCSAPVATSFGISAGIAIMLLSFGPSVLLLYKKRLEEYSDRRTASK
ncbi:MAG TPA: hypothetical protein VNW97_00565 [Candidatus Saccharimonadales bacterium]|jgi:hypothetical protein|nr:hypothetical protein [Candidatus Saccharimonadales bacterium]